VIGAPDIVILSHFAEVYAPTAEGYSGGASDVVPGSKIKYTIVLKNQGPSYSDLCIVKDYVPENTHLYYTDLPTVTGNVVNPQYTGATSNSAGPGSEISFEFSMPANGVATINYSVTVD